MKYMKRELDELNETEKWRIDDEEDNEDNEEQLDF